MSMIPEEVQDVVDHILNMQKKHDFRCEGDMIEGAVCNSAEALDIELTADQVAQACEIIKQHNAR